MRAAMPARLPCLPRCAASLLRSPSPPLSYTHTRTATGSLDGAEIEGHAGDLVGATVCGLGA